MERGEERDYIPIAIMSPPAYRLTARPNRLSRLTHDDDELMLNVLRCHLTY